MHLDASKTSNSELSCQVVLVMTGGGGQDVCVSQDMIGGGQDHGSLSYHFPPRPWPEQLATEGAIFRAELGQATLLDSATSPCRFRHS